MFLICGIINKLSCLIAVYFRRESPTMYCYAIPLGIIDIGENVSIYAFFIARCGSKVNVVCTLTTA